MFRKLDHCINITPFVSCQIRIFGRISFHCSIASGFSCYANEKQNDYKYLFELFLFLFSMISIRISIENGIFACSETRMIKVFDDAFDYNALLFFLLNIYADLSIYCVFFFCFILCAFFYYCI